MTRLPNLPRQLWLILLLTVLGCRPSEPCHDDGPTFDMTLEPDEIGDWVNEEGEFIGDCYEVCESKALVDSEKPCSVGALVDRTYPLASGGVSSGGAGGAGATGRGGDWLLRVACDYGDRKPCVYDE